MVRNAVGYTARPPFVRIDGTFNSGFNISVVLRPVAQLFIGSLRKATFQQHNTRPHVTGIIQTFFETENVWLLPWPGRSSDISPTENV